MDKLQAYNAFWNSFSLRAYDGTSVPDGAIMPYITYEAAEDGFGSPVALTASIWYRSSSWTDAVSKLKEIEQEIGMGGKIIPYQNGVMWIKKANPWAQRLGEENDDSVRRIVMNLEVEFID